MISLNAGCRTGGQKQIPRRLVASAPRDDNQCHSERSEESGCFKSQKQIPRRCASRDDNQCHSERSEESACFKSQSRLRVAALLGMTTLTGSARRSSTCLDC